MASTSITRYLPYSVAATAVVGGLPLVVVFVLMAARTNGVVAASVGVSLNILMSVLGSLVWRKRPEAVDLSFGELMIWSFLRRRRAEQRLEQGVQALGFDKEGRPRDGAELSEEERLRILRKLTNALECKDVETHGHSRRVELLAVKTATALGLSDSERDDLKTTAALHDVGKIRVPLRILKKPGRLTSEERLQVQEHSVVGARMVSAIRNPVVIEGVRHHHERWDGRGYPDGVEGPDIPLLARIVAVADSFDAMTSPRPYRPTSLKPQAAFEELRSHSGSQFDPVVVNAFLDVAPSRASLAGLLVLGPFVRRLGAWARRTGSSSLAPVSGAAGAAVLVAASVVSPPSPARTEPSHGSRSPRSSASHAAGHNGDAAAEVVASANTTFPGGSVGGGGLSALAGSKGPRASSGAGRQTQLVAAHSSGGSRGAQLLPKEQGLTPGVGIQEAEPVGVDDGDNGASADDGDQGSTPDNDKAAGDKDKDKSKDKDKDRIGRGGGNPAADPRGGDGDGNGGDGALGGSVECNQREEPDPDCPADGALDDDTNGKSKNTTGRRARKAGLKNRQAAGKEIGKRAGKHPSRHGG